MTLLSHPVNKRSGEVKEPHGIKGTYFNASSNQQKGTDFPGYSKDMGGVGELASAFNYTRKSLTASKGVPERVV